MSPPILCMGILYPCKILRMAVFVPPWEVLMHPNTPAVQIYSTMGKAKTAFLFVSLLLSPKSNY